MFSCRCTELLQANFILACPDHSSEALCEVLHPSEGLSSWRPFIPEFVLLWCYSKSRNGVKMRSPVSVAIVMANNCCVHKFSNGLRQILTVASYTQTSLVSVPNEKQEEFKLSLADAQDFFLGCGLWTLFQWALAWLISLFVVQGYECSRGRIKVSTFLQSGLHMYFDVWWLSFAEVSEDCCVVENIPKSFKYYRKAKEFCAFWERERRGREEITCSAFVFLSFLIVHCMQKTWWAFQNTHTHTHSERERASEKKAFSVP